MNGIVNATAWALIHFLWQGTLIGLLTGSVLTLLERRKASTRYAVAAGSLGLMAALPVITALQLVPSQAESLSQIQAAVVPPGSAGILTASLTGSADVLTAPLALSLLPAGTAFQIFRSHPSELEVSSPPVRLAAAEAPAPGRNEFGRRGTWSLERQSDGRVWLEMRMRSENGRDNWSNSSTFPASELQGFGAGPEVRFEIRRDAGTFHFQGRMEGQQGTGFFTFESNPGYARDMAALGYRVPEDRLLEMALHDVSLSFVREIHELGYPNVTLDKLVEFRIHGVSPAFIREMMSLGYRDVPADRLVEFRIHGVSPDFVRGLADAGYRDISPERLVEFRIHGVSPGFVRELAEAGYKDLSPERLVEFRIHGVSPEFVRELADAGYRNVSPERLVEFRIHGVSPAYIRELAEAGYRDLSSERLVEFRIHGVDGEFIREAASRGYRNLSAGDLLELKIRGRLDRGES